MQISILFPGSVWSRFVDVCVVFESFGEYCRVLITHKHYWQDQRCKIVNVFVVLEMVCVLWCVE